ncbi:MAG: hypothetical protein ACU0BS_03575 [Hasllibacter sp.]
MIRPLIRFAADLRRSVPAAALSLALVASATAPGAARADSEDVRRARAALAALGIIAYAIDEANDRDRDRRVVVRPDPPRPHRPVIEPPRAPHVPAGPRAGFLPVECVRANGTPPRDYGTRYDRRIVPIRCLHRSNVRVGTLPRQCRGTAAQTGRGQDVFGFACLRQQGYRFR